MLNSVIVVVPDGPTMMVLIKDKEHSYHHIVVNYVTVVVPDGPTVMVLIKDKELSFKTSSHCG